MADYYAGMETMIPAGCNGAGCFRAAGRVRAGGILRRSADDERCIPCVRARTAAFLAANKLAGKDTLEIYCLANPDGTRMQLISLFDNLGKGSSGAAVQCMNLMLGMNETEGLE